MKRLAGILILVTCFLPSLAQDFEGIYRGDVFSKDNVISLRIKKGVASAVLFTTANDKYSFQPVIKGRELTGTLNYAAANWSLSGILIGDSLSIVMSSGQETRQALLKRISSNPNKNVPEIIESFSRDQRLIGDWSLLKQENPDGSLKKFDERMSELMSGGIRKFSADGSGYFDFPSIRKLYNSTNTPYSQPEYKWSTKDSKLNVTSSAIKGGSASSKYEVRNDTLIIVLNGSKEFYLRKK